MSLSFHLQSMAVPQKQRHSRARSRGLAQVETDSIGPSSVIRTEE